MIPGNDDTFDVLVVGGGPAGITAALRARELGARVALIERGDLGGTCTNDGCVPTRVLARTARLVRDAEQFASYGLNGSKPTVDFGSVIARSRGVVSEIHHKKQLVRHLADAGVVAMTNTGPARFVDDRTIALEDGRRLSAERIILCVGGRARRLPFAGNELAVTHRDIWDLTELPADVVIVGGAATGCQMAECFATFGARVHLLEVAPRILAGEDLAVSEAIADAFERRGIDVVTGIRGIERAERRADGGLRVTYADADGPYTLDTDMLVLAVGWQANTESLNLEAAGIHTERGFVMVDDYLRTSAPRVFAAGDITGRMMLVQSAAWEGAVAAENACLPYARRSDHLIIPHGGFTDPEYASVGLTEEKARATQACVVATVPFRVLDRAIVDNHPEGFCKLIVAVEDRHVLGAHVVGEQALEILQLIATCMAAEMPIERLALMELAYPTFTAIVGLAARAAMRDLGGIAQSETWRGRADVAEWERAEDLTMVSAA